jgi:hypothetical protein
VAVLILAGCVSTSGTALESHKKGMESIAEKEYFIPKKPVDRAYIGCAWSKQFGPVEDPAVADIRTKKDGGESLPLIHKRQEICSQE